MHCTAYTPNSVYAVYCELVHQRVCNSQKDPDEAEPAAHERIEVRFCAERLPPARSNRAVSQRHGVPSSFRPQCPRHPAHWYRLQSDPNRLRRARAATPPLRDHRARLLAVGIEERPLLHSKPAGPADLSAALRPSKRGNHPGSLLARQAAAYSLGRCRRCHIMSRRGAQASPKESPPHALGKGGINARQFNV